MICIYARQSIDKKDSISIETQIESCYKQIDTTNNEEIIILKDKGYSGSNINRPGFAELMNYVNRGNVSKIIVYKLDRISRSLLDFAQIIEIFKTHNIDFISSVEKFDTSTPIGNAMLSIVMVFAQLERETIQLRIKDNYYSRGKKGMYLGGVAPYGYKKISATIVDKKTYTLIENIENVDTLKFIFLTYAESQRSLGSIVQELNNNNILSPNGAPWDSCKLSRIMRNPVYVKSNVEIYKYYKKKGCILSNPIEDFNGENGCYLYGKRTANERKYTNLKDHTVSIALHKGIIDPNIFLKCQYKLDENKQIKKSGASSISFLSGLTKCPYCGYAMTISKSTPNKFYFICSGRKNKIPCSRTVLSWDMCHVESIITELLFEKSKNIDMTVLTEQKNEKTNYYEIELFKIDEQIQNLITEIAIGNKIVAKYLNEKITELDTQKQNMLNEIKDLQKCDINSEKIFKVKQLLEKWDVLQINEKKEVVKYFIKQIDIYDDNMDVTFNI